jgi:hypothetical protein
MMTEDDRHSEINDVIKKLRKDAVALSDSEVKFYISQYEEQTEQGRHLETERSTVTNIVGAVAAAILVYMGTKEFNAERLSWLAPLASLALTALGLYGFIMSRVLYGRFLKHMDFAYGFRRLLEERLPAVEAKTIREVVNGMHKKEIRLHRLWPAFNLAVAILGLALAIWLSWEVAHPKIDSLK